MQSISAQDAQQEGVSFGVACQKLKVDYQYLHKFLKQSGFDQEYPPRFQVHYTRVFNKAELAALRRAIRPNEITNEPAEPQEQK